MKKTEKTLSLCMIVKDEEKTLSNCLNSILGLFDEIVIVDTGSTDKTKEIAKKYTNKIFNFKWIDDFSSARNFAFSKASGKYIMWLDADDVVEKTDLEELLNLKKQLNGSVDVYMLKYAMQFDENNNPNFVFYRERILKNDGSFIWQDPVHEAIVPHGKIEYSNIKICHKKTHLPTDRNLKIYENFVKKGGILSARQKFYYGRELKDNLKYDEAVKILNLFLSDDTGWIENKIEACLTLSNCYANLNDFKNALKVLFDSFVFDEPRAEILCEIGNLLMKKKMFKMAIYWLKLALKIKMKINRGSFVLINCYGLIPHLLLCVCYYNLGKIKKAEQENNLAYKINPTDIAVLANKKFFDNLKK